MTPITAPEQVITDLLAMRQRIEDSIATLRTVYDLQPSSATSSAHSNEAAKPEVKRRGRPAKAEPAPTPIAHKKPGPKPKVNAARQPVADIAQERGGKPTCAAEITKLLEKRHMGSGELVRTLGNFHPSAIYLALKNMREAGTVQTKIDPDDAQTKNYLVRAA
jgi:hypothetical protein